MTSSVLYSHQLMLLQGTGLLCLTCQLPWGHVSSNGTRCSYLSNSAQREGIINSPSFTLLRTTKQSQPRALKLSFEPGQQGRQGPSTWQSRNSTFFEQQCRRKETILSRCPFLYIAHQGGRVPGWLLASRNNILSFSSYTQSRGQPHCKTEGVNYRQWSG